MLVRTLATLSLAASLGVCHSTSAANLNFLGHSIASEMSKEEVESFTKTVNNALNESPDLVTINWHSESSDRRGRVKIKYSYEYEGSVCRKAILDLRASDNRRDFFHFNVCQHDQHWQLQKSPASRFSDTEWQALREQFIAAANNNADGQTSVEPLAGGPIIATITPKSSTRINDQKCRLMSIALADKQHSSAHAVYHFCFDGEVWSRHQP